MNTFLSIFAVFLVLFIFLTIERATRNGILALFLKCACSLCFLIVFLTSLQMYPSNELKVMYDFVMLALILSLVGDLFVGLHNLDIYPISKSLSTGLKFFFMAHAFFVLSLIGGYGLDFISFLIAFLVSLLSIPLISGLEKLKMKYFDVKFGTYKTSVMYYSAVLIFVTTFALTLAIKTANLVLCHFAGCLILFLLSDLILVKVYFSRDDRDKEYKVLKFINLVLYYLAQFGIAALPLVMHNISS